MREISVHKWRKLQMNEQLEEAVKTGMDAANAAVGTVGAEPCNKTGTTVKVLKIVGGTVIAIGVSVAAFFGIKKGVAKHKAKVAAKKSAEATEATAEKTEEAE